MSSFGLFDRPFMYLEPAHQAHQAHKEDKMARNKSFGFRHDHALTAAQDSAKYHGTNKFVFSDGRNFVLSDNPPVAPNSHWLIAPDGTIRAREYSGQEIIDMVDLAV